MPPRGQPTARQQRLGAELRKLRETAGFSAKYAAELLGTNPIQMSHMEAGRSGVSEERLRRMAALYACQDRALIDALVAMAGENGKGWWDAYRDVLPPVSLDLAELEHRAVHLHLVQISHIPGLLQTEAHARASFAYAVPELEPDALDALVAHRMHRQVVFERSTVPEVVAIIHEAALRIRVGGVAVARQQLRHLCEFSESGRVEVRVIPFEADAFAGAGATMYYAGGAVPQLDTVQLDAPHGVIFLDALSQLARYRTLFGKLKRDTLDVVESRDRIHRIEREL
ncbi:helix-turn-helix domain-containing protein [Streptomyces xiamenensis]|uniref:helix-turn-helix domain-containing protein n=1 Tax=Streptomyces xiamenensis TaxID=408015 RepID=UPI0036E8CDEF